MSEVHHVKVHVQLPSKTKEAQFAYGWYTVTDDR